LRLMPWDVPTVMASRSIGTDSLRAFRAVHKLQGLGHHLTPFISFQPWTVEVSARA